MEDSRSPRRLKAVVISVANISQEKRAKNDDLRRCFRGLALSRQRLHPPGLAESETWQGRRAWPPTTCGGVKQPASRINLRSVKDNNLEMSHTLQSILAL